MSTITLKIIFQTILQKINKYFVILYSDTKIIFNHKKCTYIAELI